MKQLLITIAAVLLVGCGPSVPDDTIHLAASLGDIETVKQHLAAGTDVNTKDKYKKTPLFGAARNGHKEIAELLITNGADVNAIMIIDTPLDYAIISKHTEIAELLRKHGGKTGEELKAEGK